MAPEKNNIQIPPKRQFRRLGCWSLLFVDDLGNVIHFEWTKKLLWVLLLFAIMLVFMGVWGIKVISDATDDRTFFENALADKEQEVLRLREENEKLLVKLMIKGPMPGNEVKSVLEEKHEKVSNDIPKKAPEKIIKKKETIKKPVKMTKPANIKKPDKPTLVKKKEDPKSKSIEEKKDTPVALSAVPEKTPQPRLTPETAEIKKKLKVVVNNFSATLDSDKNTLRVRFKISNMSHANTSQTRTRISGYTVVLLKNDKEGSDEWVTLPAAAADTEDSVKAENGQAFSINNFMHIVLSSIAPMEPKNLNTATVFVFDQENNMISETDFPINLTQ